MDEQELDKEIEHQKNMLRILHNRLHQRELQEAQYGINVPPEITSEISILSERIRNHKAKLEELQTLAVEDQIPLSVAEYRVMLLQAWNSPRGKPDIAGIANLELARLRLGITLQQANTLEYQVRVALANENFYSIHHDYFRYIPTERAFNGFDAFKVWGEEVQLNSVNLHQFLESIDREKENNFGPLEIKYEILGLVMRNEPLQYLGRAICLDYSTALTLFMKYLPTTPPNILKVGRFPTKSGYFADFVREFLEGQSLLFLDLSNFKEQLIQANNIWNDQEEYSLFEKFIRDVQKQIEADGYRTKNQYDLP